MASYGFTIILEGDVQLTDAECDRLYKAGCDDSSPGRSQGVTGIAFDREGESLEEAIQSAIRDVRAAGFRVSRVETDETELVSRLNQQLAS